MILALTISFSLYDNPEDSDLTIKSGTVTFNAHLNILSLRTSFFRNALVGGFKEAKDRTITIEDHSTHAVWRFLKWCYTSDYPATSNNLTLGEGRRSAYFLDGSYLTGRIEDSIGALRHAKVYYLADMLCIDGLKTLATTKFEQHLQNQWVLADFHEIVKDVYSNTESSDTKLRDVLLKSAADHHEALKAVEAYKSVLIEYGEFSGTLVLRNFTASNTGTKPATKKLCPSCSRSDGRLQYYCTNYCGTTYDVSNP